MHNSSGKLIMFDGPDGVGKTTQLNLAADAIRQKGYKVYLTKTHGGTPIGEALRTVSLSTTERSPLTDMYISLAMHAELAQLIDEKRERGIIVLVDRSPLSNIAYQAYGSGLDVDFTIGFIDIDMQLFQPDCIIVFDAPLSITRQRMSERNQQNNAKREYFESKSDEYFERVADGYRAAAAHFQASIVDANDSITEVHKHTMKIIKKVLA